MRPLDLRQLVIDVLRPSSTRKRRYAPSVMLPFPSRSDREDIDVVVAIRISLTSTAMSGRLLEVLADNLALEVGDLSLFALAVPSLTDEYEWEEQTPQEAVDDGSHSGATMTEFLRTVMRTEDFDDADDAVDFASERAWLCIGFPKGIVTEDRHIFGWATTGL